MRQGVENSQHEHGAQWVDAFVEFYLGYKRTCALDDACGLQVLTPEVIRADAAVRAHYEQELRRVVDQVAQGLPQSTTEARQAAAWALLALLSGGVTLTRSMADPHLSEATAGALRVAALQVARTPG